MTDQRMRRWIALVALGALGLRIASAVVAFASPEGDAADYDRLAMSLLQGQGYVSPEGPLTSERPPLYSFVLAGLYGLVGHSYGVALGLQIGLSVASCVLIALLGARLFSPAAGIAAGCLAAINTGFIASARAISTRRWWPNGKELASA